MTTSLLPVVDFLVQIARTHLGEKQGNVGKFRAILPVGRRLWPGPLVVLVSMNGLYQAIRKKGEM